MGEVTEHAPGTFCWIDASVNDVAEAKRFYGEILGWSFVDLPMGEGQVYSMAQIRGKDVAALSPQQPEMREQGIPPHWTAYIAVKSVDETAAKVEGLGGKLLAPPFDVLQVGRMAVVQDPTGAVVALWEARGHIGASLVGDVGALCWVELLTTDTARAAAFYGGLLGWTTKASAVPGMAYHEFYAGERAVGGMMQITPEMPPMPSNWGVYFTVDDCDASAERAQRLGAKQLYPSMDVQNVGRMTSLMDPQGAYFSIIKMAPQPG